jgi:hypothetical protein
MSIAIDDGRKLPANFYLDKYGIYGRLKIGSGDTPYRTQARFPFGTPDAQLITWRERERARLEAQRDKDQADKPPEGSLEAAVARYLADERFGPPDSETRKRRRQRLEWWCAQPATHGKPPLSVDELTADPTLAKRAGRLGLVPRSKIDLKRVREILDRAFRPSGEDPTEFANTSNHYRMALVHLWTVLDEDNPAAVNPITKIHTRRMPEIRPSGQDLRVVAEILTQVSSRFGRDSKASQLRLAVLAWVLITPVQLKRLTDVAKAFHDQPQASREDIIDGAITLELPPRFKGRAKRIPRSQMLPLTPWGVAALRALAAEPSAWGTFSTASLNKIFKRACGRAQAALTKRGIEVDLSEMTLYHLKHSLASAAQVASTGQMLDRQGRWQPVPGLQRALHHGQSRTTRFYTEAAVEPSVRLLHTQLSLYIDALFAQPLRATAQLRLVAGRKDEVNEP